MSQHGREHEERLAALLAGEVLATDPDVARMLASCATCQETWTIMQKVSTRLDEAAAQQDAALAEIEGLPPEPGEELLLARLQQLAMPERRRPRRMWAFAALAAGLLLCLWLVRAFVGEEPRRTWLNEKDLHLLAPVGAVPSFARFEWKYDKEAASYVLRIYADEHELATPLLEPLRTKESTWTPDAATLEKLPESIYWEVQAFDVFGEQLAARGASASR